MTQGHPALLARKAGSLFVLLRAAIYKNADTGTGNFADFHHDVSLAPSNSASEIAHRSG